MTREFKVIITVDDYNTILTALKLELENVKGNPEWAALVEHALNSVYKAEVVR